jgi:hypothetical protein
LPIAYCPLPIAHCPLPSDNHIMPRKKKKPDTSKNTKPTVHERLKGFDIRVNSFGEMESTFGIDKLNSFLNEEVKDKKIDGAHTSEEE